MRLRNKAFRIDMESEIRLKNLEKQIEKMRRNTCSPHFFMDVNKIIFTVYKVF